MTEAQHQSALFEWTRQPTIRKRMPELKYLYHIPNGGRRDPIEAKHLKSQGVKSGVPDLHLPVARKGFNSLYIEMKTETGRTSEAQEWWLAELVRQGNYAVVCRGWKEAVKCLTWYLT